MNREEFDLLNVNIMAITNRILSKRSDALIADMAKNMHDMEDLDSEAETSAFTETIEELSALGISSEKSSDILIQEGYDSLDELKHQFDFAYNKLDADKLSQLLEALPPLRVNLKCQMTGGELDQCIYVLEKEENEDVFNQLHQFSATLFYDPSSDFILQCLADEDINILIDNEDQINNESITYENIENAVMFNALDIVQWLAERYTFKTDDISNLLLMAADDGAEYFKEVLRILKPDKASVASILLSLDDQEMAQIVQSY